MMETVRAFVAVELPPAVKGALAELIEHLRQAQIRGLRLVKPDGIHLTLKFFGDIPASQAGPIAAAVSEVAKAHKPFALELGGAGVFPNRSSPRVLWVGVEGDMPSLLALQQGVEERLATLGFDREKRGFNPHLTLARVNDGTSLSDRRRAAEALLSAPIRPGLKIDVRSLSLMRSRLMPGGAVYGCMASMPLSSDFCTESSK